MKEEETRDLVNRFFDAAEKGDIETMDALYADDAIIWHNNDGIEQTKSENIDLLIQAFKRLPARKYTERKLNIFDGGFVQQHKFLATRMAGDSVEMPAVVVGMVENGKIKRIDEYFETTALTKLRAP